MVLQWLSQGLTPATPILERPLIPFTAASVVAGMVFWLLVLAAPSLGQGRFPIIGVLLVGLAMRLVLFPSAVIREDDHFRYLLDGAMVANGFDPYALQPKAVREGAGPLAIPEDVRRDVIQHINHPELTTIYPPGALAAFALAHWIAPWELTGLRIVFLLCDLLGFLITLRLLTALSLPRLWVVFYWWNPLTLAQVYNHLHFEVMLFPAILGALYFSASGLRTAAAAALALAAGIKVWPALMLGPLLWQDRERVMVMAARAAMASAIIGILLLPLLATALERDSGLGAYASRWLFNDPLLALLAGLAPEGAGQTLFRATLAGVAAGTALWVSYRTAQGPHALAQACFLIALVVFALSPAKFPWYALWLAPFLALIPSLPVAALMATMPIYYLWFWFDPRGQGQFYLDAVAWAQYVPVLVIIAFGIFVPQLRIVPRVSRPQGQSRHPRAQ
ncbi:MAG TPA: hypothetical protein DCL54_01545 [Alphaproteobacteria bacterium]|nr:hypothetical protein [Alphaproteobacteria bacterium]HAJ45250.1 hypothetical protein [Alphaproteobacteria bacterium]